jgi:hypothetical protein
MGRRGGRLFARRFHVTGAIAVACHALAVGLMMTRGAPRVAPQRAPDEPIEPIAPIAVEIDADPETPRAPSPPEAPARSAPIAVARARTRATMMLKAAPESVAEGTGALLTPLGSLTEGLPGSSPAAPATAVAVPDRLPPPLLPRALHAPAAALGGPLAAPEGQADMSASAQVRATVQRVAEAKGPAQGHGMIRITVDEDGSVSGVVVSGTGWEAAANAIRAALAGRRVHVPTGARGVVISFLADAYVTHTPPVLTGEARAQSMRLAVPAEMAPPTDDEHRGGVALPAPNAAVIDPRALLPIPRRVVKLDSLGEQPR